MTRNPPVKEKSEITCKQCSRKFLVYDCYKNQKFCSRNCHSLFMKGKVVYCHPITRVKRICLNCGNEYYVVKSRENNSHFCSLECNGSYRHKNHIVTNKCEFCGKLYYPKKPSVKRKYCSYDCSHKATQKNVKIICVVCGKTFMVKLERAKNDNPRYCSHKCHMFLKHNSHIQVVKCKTCDKEFELTLSKIKNGRVHCSRECFANDPMVRESRRQNIVNRFGKGNMTYSPNGYEVQLSNMIKGLNLPYKFVGNGEIWISGLNPDFINTNGQKKIIELFGEPWHGRSNSKKLKVKYSSTEIGRKNIFGRFGYDTLVIWSKELKDMDAVKSKILAFDSMSRLGE